ncbi:hypothetical protein AAFF_G00238580 [Aldrovandia affinis]|uniref:Uncharacterized protein n=1 Tax=Aldrovandia affinis TaxID=143900 RepID=A0AAD7REF0_9TELE|nr:hypothetical protein AAFF_G00238580 [Aldrovandia affinis]
MTAAKRETERELAVQDVWERWERACQNSHNKSATILHRAPAQYYPISPKPCSFKYFTSAPMRPSGLRLHRLWLLHDNEAAVESREACRCIVVAQGEKNRKIETPPFDPPLPADGGGKPCTVS